MDEYKILNQKTFESANAFEKKLNEICRQGWRPISMASDHGNKSVLLQRIDKYDS